MIQTIFPDASKDAWASVITQIPPEDKNLPVHEQRHELLAFFGKRFTGSAKHWTTIKKEACAINETLTKGEYLLCTGRKFMIYTDHRNLTFIFGRPDAMKKHAADKLQRWAMHVQAFNYDLYSIKGEDNTWPDLLTRWGAGKVALTARTVTLSIDDLRLKSMDKEAFQWPKEEEIRMEQQKLTERQKNEAIQGEDGIWRKEERVLCSPSTSDVTLVMLITNEMYCRTCRTLGACTRSLPISTGVYHCASLSLWAALFIAAPTASCV